MLWPPVVRISQDGAAIFYRDQKFYSGKIAPGQLNKLKAKLKSEKLLRKTRYVETRHGDPVNIHGGMVYIRYLAGGQRVILATELFPRRGSWKRVIHLVRSYLPRDGTPFYPTTIQLRIWKDTSGVYRDRKLPATWPFSERLNLSGGASGPPPGVTTSDPVIIRYLFQNLHGSFSFFTWDFEINNQPYWLELERVPGWYNDDDLDLRLMGLVWDWERLKSQK